MDKGALYENFVASELLKKGEIIQYWRTKSKAEVDFVLEKEGKVIPIEVKSNLNKPIIERSLHSFIEKYSPSQSVILSEKLWTKKKEVIFRPIFWVGRV